MSFESLARIHGASNAMAVKREVDRLCGEATEESKLSEIGKLMHTGPEDKANRPPEPPAASL